MANKKILLGMLAVLLVFGASLVGCEYGDPGLEGTWKKTTSSSYEGTQVNTLTFTAGDYEEKTVVTTAGDYSSLGTRTSKGTYVASNGLIGITITSTTDTRSGGSTDSDRSVSTVKYVIYGNTLIISGGVYTKE
jgi:hypothetical protein